MLLPRRREGMWACLTWVDEQPTDFAMRTKAELLQGSEMTQQFSWQSWWKNPFIGSQSFRIVLLAWTALQTVLMDLGKLCCLSSFQQEFGKALEKEQFPCTHHSSASLWGSQGVLTSPPNQVKNSTPVGGGNSRYSMSQLCREKVFNRSFPKALGILEETLEMGQFCLSQWDDAFL